jgi:hypothetical protein
MAHNVIVGSTPALDRTIRMNGVLDVVSTMEGQSLLIHQTASKKVIR